MTEQELTAGDMSGYKCGYCGCWHSYSYEMCRDLTMKGMNCGKQPSCWDCQGKSIEIDRLRRENAQLKKMLRDLDEYIEGCLV